VCSLGTLFVSGIYAQIPCIKEIMMMMMIIIIIWEWRKLHNEELNGLYSLPSIVRVIKSRRLRWAGHVAHIGRERCVQGSGGEV
jgi:hypothetical protein